MYRNQTPVYLVKDDHGEILEGTFYAEEIPKLRYPKFWLLSLIKERPCCPCHSVPFARLTLQTAMPRFCRSCLKIQLLKDSGYPSHFTKYCTLLPFRRFFRTLWSCIRKLWVAKLWKQVWTVGPPVGPPGERSIKRAAKRKKPKRR
jgi:hypothetical protein